jgi:hypothetical protein
VAIPFAKDVFFLLVDLGVALPFGKLALRQLMN